MTQEMLDIVNSTENHIIVQARAGTGKTTTIMEYIKAHPNEKILYTVFSAEMKREAESRFKGLKNCEIRTFHSLAYRWWVNKNKYTRYLGLNYKDMIKQFKELTQLEIQKILHDYELDYENLKYISFYYNMFLCSDKKTPYELELVEKEDKKYLDLVNRIYEYHLNNYVPVPHNFYLKQYSLTNPKLSNYQTLLADECQDINDATLNIILSNLDKKIIAVGDSAQSIFNFMHCKNSLKILKEQYKFKEYKLTKSFRISNKVADMCSRLLKWFYEEDMSFEGNNNTKVEKMDLETTDKPITILSRTRIGALLEVLSILDIRPEAKIYYYGGLDKFDLSTIEKIINYDGYMFIDGEKFHINTLRKMQNEGLDDPVISGIISRYDFIRKHDNCLQLLKNSEVKNIKDANFCINTLHGCKGSTYDNVKLADDIGGVSSLKLRYKIYKEKNNNFKIREIENQLNLLYVGLSRATNILDIGNVFIKEDRLADSLEIKNLIKEMETKE